MRGLGLLDLRQRLRTSRRGFLRGVAWLLGSFLFVGLRSKRARAASSPRSGAKPNTVYVVKNGDCFQNIDTLWTMIGGPQTYIDPRDVVVIKANGQWPKQGYTHSGCIKAVIDKILAIPGFSGEILICDNVQNFGSEGSYGFDATPGPNREHNWPDHNWNSLAAEYQAHGQPVATKRWLNSETNITGPWDGEGWIRDFFDHHGTPTYYSYPIFESPLTPGRMIDMKNGVWEDGSYGSRGVKAIFMPTLNNHGDGKEDYAGVTSAIKSFLGSTEILYGVRDKFQEHYNWHGATFSGSVGNAGYAGELTAKYITEMYAPVLYITAAMWSGHDSREGDAVETKTVLACTNPATLDYVACRDVIGPHAPYLDPDEDNNTRAQILGCIRGGVGSIDPGKMRVVVCDLAEGVCVPTPAVPWLQSAALLCLGWLLARRPRILS